MKRKDFIGAIEKIESELNKDYSISERTSGLWSALYWKIGSKAKKKFYKIYRSKFIHSSYLAPLDTEEGLKTRIKYLHKFKRRMLWTFGYWKF